jgi:TPR repeat protein
MGRKRTRQGKFVYLLLACIICSCLIEGCASFQDQGKKEDQKENALREAEVLFYQGDYRASLQAFRKELGESSRSESRAAGKSVDEALFYMGLIYTAPKYPERDYQKSLDIFLRLARDFPDSRYREEAERYSNLLKEILGRDKRIRLLKREVDLLGSQIGRMKEIDLDVEEKRRNILREK